MQTKNLATNNRAFIIADPLLACRTDLGHGGFVFALAADALKFAIVPTENSPTPRALQMLLSPDAPFTLELVNVRLLETSSAQYVAEIHDPVGQAWLRDALGKIRKNQHIAICAEHDVEASDRRTGFEQYSFVPQALPELNLSDVKTNTTFLRRNFAAPILITGMTGGIEQGAEINRRLALAAEHAGIPMGIGSQRIALENPALAPIFAVKKHAPKVFLISNIGAAQLANGVSISDCQRAIDMVEADAIAVHVNVLQETVQVEGDHNFRGLLDQIAKLKAKLKIPLIIKEVGSGIDPKTAKRLTEIGVDAIDVGGRGGTAWGYIEGKRSTNSLTQHAANTFRDWGIPTARCLEALRADGCKTPLIATGGIRSGLDVAKAIALGANMAGIGLPLFRAALSEDESAVDQLLATYVHELKIAMLCTGTSGLSELSDKLQKEQSHV